MSQSVSTKDVFPVMIDLLKQGQEVRFTVSGNSMFPLIVDNRDQVLLVACDETCLHKGDIILFMVSEHHYVLHRITKVVNGGYITTGDGNCHRDGFVSCENVLGKVAKIYRKEKEIDVQDWKWKLVFWGWNFLFPVRKQVFQMIQFVYRAKRKLISK